MAPSVKFSPAMGLIFDVLIWLEVRWKWFTHSVRAQAVAGTALVVLLVLATVYLASCTYRWGYEPDASVMDAGPDAGN